MSEIEYYKGYQIKISQDDCGESPREWDNLGTMSCWHRNYLLGDKPKETAKYIPEDFFRYIVSDLWKRMEKSKEFLTWKKKNPEEFHKDDLTVDNYIDCMEMSEIMLWMEKYYVILPIHAYEHGGITISTGRFSCMFDSGQLGYIYVSKEKAMEEWKIEKWNKKFEKEVEKYLEGEVKTYDQFLTGDVWGYQIYEENDVNRQDEIESCWGFYGQKDTISEAKSIIDYLVNQKLKENQELAAEVE